MTINEWLFVAGLLDLFSEAVCKKDRDEMLRLLRKVDAEKPERSLDRALAPPEQCGFNC